MDTYVDMKKQKLIFAVVLMLVLFLADLVCALYLLNDNCKVITYNDADGFEDSCDIRIDPALAAEIDRAVSGDDTASGAVNASRTNSTSTGSKSGNEHFTDEQVVVISVALLDAVILIAGFTFYFLIKNVRNKKAGRVSACSIIIALVLLAGFLGLSYWHTHITAVAVMPVRAHAPVIYLYDEGSCEANVKLRLNGELTCTYPLYGQEEGWTVRTSPDGTLTDRSGRQYEYLFWEADLYFVPDLSKGFCVEGKDTAAFLEQALSNLGLSDAEANAFIMYWLPQMECNTYNVISFQTESFENAAELDVSPAPDTVVRVNMVFYATDSYVKITPQDLTSMNPALSERHGFVLVEWGGERLDPAA